MSEMPMKHLTVSLTDIMTTDPYEIGEATRKRLEMIPIAQSISMNAIFSLRVENTTDGVIDILSDSIKLNGVAHTNDITDAIPICDINSDTSFTINDIHVVESYGFDNARISIGPIGYEILDVDMTKSSLTISPSKFRFSLNTPGILKPIELVRKAIDCLVERLDVIDYNLSIVEFDTFKLSIPNETHSIGKMLSWYIYQIEPTIDYCASRILHPSKRECVIDIRHPSAKELCIKAVENIKIDLAAIRTTFA
jgi:DNA-directed RNA polymerase subunit L